MAKTMKTVKQLTVAALLAFALTPGVARADSWPQLVAYQGVLHDSQGRTYSSGTYIAEFRLWNAASGGTNVWGKAYQFSVVTGGEFNMILGDSTGTELSPPITNGLTTAVRSNPNLYMAIVLTHTPSGAVTSPHELAPRQQWTSSAYALKSSVADNTLALAGSEALLVGNLNKAQVPAGGMRLVGMSNDTVVYLPAIQTNGTLVVERNVTVPSGRVIANGNFRTDVLRGLPGSTLSLGKATLFGFWNSVPFGATQVGTNSDVWVMVQLPDMTQLPASGDYSIRLTANGQDTTLFPCMGALTGGYQGFLSYPLPANTSWRVYSNTPYPANLPIKVWSVLINNHP